MIHHDSRDYDEASSAAAAKGREKMEEIIHKGQASAEAVVSIIQNRVVKDKVKRANDLRLWAERNDQDTDYEFVLSTGHRADESHRIHPHAFKQLVGQGGADIGSEFVNKVLKEAKGLSWGHKLVEHTVNEILAHRPPADRHLIRIDTDDGDRVKGFLSDKYRRLDSRPLADAFMGMAAAAGLVPIEGVASDTKCRVRAVLPKVFEPIRNEVMIFGLEFGNSDFGDGGVQLNLWTMRTVCTNLAITQRGLRQVHLGKRLPDDLNLSDEYYRKDAETLAIAMRDIGNDLIGPGRINSMMEAVQNASEQEIRSADGIDKYLRGLDKSEAQMVRTLYDGNDELNLPAGQTVYRLSNAVSFFAQARNIGADRRLELQEIAGKMLVPEQSAKSIREV